MVNVDPQKISEFFFDRKPDMAYINKNYMDISLILAHPDQNSFNHAIAHTALDALIDGGHTVRFHDLYKEQFDPILYSEEIPRDTALDPIIACHCHEIANADGIIIVHPNWWGQPPAILKGWVDRVIRPGIAYRFLEGDNGEGIPVGLLKARAVIVFNTANTPEERENAVFGDPLERIWKDCIFDLCGVSQFHRRMFRIIVTSDEIRRASWLSEVKEMVLQVFPKE